MAETLPDRDELQRRLVRLRNLARVYDAGIRIPGTRFEFGLDPLVGLVPGLGDAVGAGLATYIVFEAARSGVPWSVLVRMLLNVGIDALIGAFPVVGDLFDAAWKANLKNVDLLDAHLADPRATRHSSRRLLIAVGLVLLLLFVGAVALALAVLRAVVYLFTAS
ncbi:MAG TPA: DUF4112 domain-containing protein [Gemmatimonadales bacterium]|jgi:hypothetical protein